MSDKPQLDPEAIAAALKVAEGTPTSPTYQNRTTSVTKRVADTLRERGAKSGTLALRIARKIDPQAYHGQRMRIAGADLTVVDPAQA